MKKLLFIFISMFLLVGCGKTKTYKVNFDSDGGTKIKSEIVEENKKVDEPEVPKKDGYIFVSWMLDGEVYDFSSKVTKDITLVSDWEKVNEKEVTYIVKFDSNGGTTIQNQIIKENELVKKPQDPIKNGYVFKGWKMDTVYYNFDTPVIKNIILVADWKKEEPKKEDTKNEEPKKEEEKIPEIKLSTPKLTKGVVAVGEGNIISLELKYEKITNMSGIELYSSTLQNGEYKLVKTISNQKETRFETTLYYGEHLYYKVRAYAETKKGKVYSDYSNIIEYNNKINTPQITKAPSRAAEDGSIYFGLIVDDVETITGVELYVSSAEGGTYKLQQTVTKDKLINGNEIDNVIYPGQNVYYKVRTYTEIKSGKFYSDYSNVINNSASPESITIVFQGGGQSPEGAGFGFKIESSSIADLEIYSSTEENGNYKLLQTVSKNEYDHNTEISVKWNHPSNNYTMYIKVRFKYAEGIYSGFSNIISRKVNISE